MIKLKTGGSVMMKAIYKNIRDRRKELKLTQTDLAQRLGYADKSMIAKIERGLVDLPQNRIEAFAQALGTTPEALTGWTEERKASSFSYCLEQQMRFLGWVVLYDADGNVILTHDGAEYEVTEENIKELESRVALYIEFLLTDLAKNSRKIGG